MKKRDGMSIGLGIPTIFFVFLMVALCLLTLLTYLKAKQNDVSVNKEIASVSSYYEADSKMQYVLNGLEKNENMDSFMNKNEIYFKNDDNLTIIEIDVDENHILHVSMQDGNILEYKVEEKENGS